MPRDNALAGALSTEIRAGSLEGETVGLLSMRQQEEVFLCRLESGGSAPFAFLATVSNEVDARARAMTGLAEWEFIAVAEPDESPKPDSPNSEQDTGGNSTFQQSHTLPQTGDTALVALAGLATAGALVIALVAQRNRRP